MAQSSHWINKYPQNPKDESQRPFGMKTILSGWLYQTGFLVASRETDHRRKGIDWKDIHLLIKLLRRLENQALKTGRTRRRSSIWSQPKSSQKSTQWDQPCCWAHGPCLARLPRPGTEHRYRPWKRDRSAAVVALHQDRIPTVPVSLHLFLQPDSKSGAGWPSLGGVPWAFDKQVSSMFHFYNERWLRHPTKTHTWGVSPNLEMDSSARKPEKWQISVITDW